jgi:hypothetical protein
LQGEGQEFESPRLHQLRRAGVRNRIAPGPIVTTEGDGRTVLLSDPLIRALSAKAGHRPADRWATKTSVDVGDAPLEVGRTLTTGMCFGRLKSSISPSSQGNDPDWIPSATDHLVRGWRGSSYKGHGVDALAPRADEGRGRLRKASGSREQTLIRRCPNGETRLGSCPVTPG